jgi:hypothetical protein
MKELILITCNASDLEGPALDWAVALAEGVKVALAAPAYGNGWRVRYDLLHTQAKYSPSADWDHAGPLIVKHRVSLIYAFEQYEALIGMTVSEQSESALIAACRAVVSSALGDTVSVPKELLA